MIPLTESETRARRRTGLVHRVDLLSGRGYWLRPALAYLIYFAILVSASYLAYAFVRPSWRAPGLPQFIGYGKNVEQAAIGLTLLGLTCFVTCRCTPRLSFATLTLIAVVAAILNLHYGGRIAVVTLMALVAANGLYLIWYDQLRDRASPSEVSPGSGLGLGAWSFLILASLYGFLTGLRTIGIDVHHHGEQITSALDLLDGGIPFRTYYWPHGLSETGITALLIRLTGNRGMGTIHLYRAFDSILKVCSIFVLARSLTRGNFLACLGTGLIMLLSLRQIPSISTSLFALLALLTLARSTSRAGRIATGCLLGFAYIWRVETGVFALATTGMFLFIDRYYVKGYSHGLGVRELAIDRSRLRGLGWDCLQIAAGLSCTFLLLRLVLGFPTWDWFRETLISLPRYHADSTGYPLPLALKHHLPAFSWEPGVLLILIGFPMMMLLALATYVGTLRKIVERRLPLVEPRDRVYLTFLLYALFSLKNVFDRSDPYHVVKGTQVLALVVLFDGLEYLRLRLRPAASMFAGSFACVAFGAFFWTCFYNTGEGRFLRPPSSECLENLRNSWQPTSSIEQMLTPAKVDGRDDIIDGVNQVRRLLEANHIGKRQLLVYHSGALYYALLERQLPTKYYCLGWAASRQMEVELIEELKRNRVRAFLQVNGLRGSLKQYDVPDDFRIPLVHRFISSMETLGRRYETKLGTLTVLTEGDHDR